MNKRAFSMVAAFAAASGAAQAAPVLNPGNGHYYEYFSTGSTWQSALASAAAATPLAGFQSYLVTITDAAENTFVSTLANSAIFWTSGTDQEVEGVWKWAAGPELGQIFFGPGTPAGTYSNFNSGEPNNSGNEDYLHANFGRFGGWNDVYPTYGNGYVVEYSRVAPAIPEPASWAMMIGGFALAGSVLRRRRTAMRLA